MRQTIREGTAPMSKKSDSIRFAKSTLIQWSIGIGAVIIGGILTWLTAGEGIAVVMDWFKPVKIIASSVSRHNIDTFISGEKVRFFIEPIKTDKVLWMFGEKDVQHGGVEIEYAFAYDTSLSEGITIDHRVDAFFKDEGKYRTVSTTVRTQNVRYQASVLFTRLKVLLTTMKELEDRWQLDSVYMAKYESGEFKLMLGFKVSEILNSDSIFASVSIDKFLKAFDYPRGTDLRTLFATNPNAWIAYDFVDRESSERITILQNVGNLL
jgi:hypothetical protein